MKLRKYSYTDLKEICNLFYETITTVNINDYDSNQIKVWSNRYQFLLKQHEFFNSQYTIVAVKNDKIIGYGNIDEGGYLDQLYVHKDYQKQHVATTICDELENHCHDITCLTVHASITARPFFEKRGYRVIKEQVVTIDNTHLTNYLMKKEKS